MPRQARIDAPGALHHIIIRGIEKRSIFRDDQDRDNFLERLGRILSETSTPCYAWALMHNHSHLLLRTGRAPIATVMRRLLTGYAQQFNRRHNRHGQLFQNRYKSILCEEDPYLLELVRYIHLNPLRASIVTEFKQLKSYHYCGHAVLMGTTKHAWHHKDYVLKYFGRAERQARKEYASFVAEGLGMGRQPNLVGGGLLRSVGGWSSLKAHRRQGTRIKGDERILGSGDFVEKVLERANEELEQRTRFQVSGLSFDILVSSVADYFGLKADKLITACKEPIVVKARSTLCYIAVRKLMLSGKQVALKLNISPSAVSKAIRRGESILLETEIEKVLGES
jgi:putative transposase